MATVITQEEINKQLMTESNGVVGQKLIADWKSQLTKGRAVMRKFYPRWNKQAQVYRGERWADEQDRKARERGEPTKFIVPIAYAQIETFISFLFMLFTQKEMFFELAPGSNDRYWLSVAAEKFLQRDLDHNNYPAELHQTLKNYARYGLCVMKHGWTEEVIDAMVPVTVPQIGMMSGEPIGEETTMEPGERIVYEGNKVKALSPYKWIPDPALPVMRFQEGDFCASEEHFTRQSVEDRESRGEVFGVKWIPDLKLDGIQDRGIYHYYMTQERSIGNPDGDVFTKKSIIITEMQISVIPSKFRINLNGDPEGSGKVLGTGTKHEKWIMEIANDARVIRFEPMGNEHNEYSFDVCEYSPDSESHVNPGLGETIDPLQEHISWFINSHVTSVRKTVGNQMLVDPSGIELQDIKDRSPVIRLKPVAYRSGVDKWIKQLPINDVTRNHVNDAMTLKDVVQYVTGINENAMGQYAAGRRSAKESGAVNSGASMRIKTPATLINSTMLRPMALKMIRNLRQSISMETWQQVMGNEGTPELFAQFTDPNASVEGEFDFMVFDTTLPSEKQAQAEALQEALMAMMQNPAIPAMFGYGPADLKTLFETILRLRGIPVPPTQAQMQMMSGQPPQVMPPQNVIPGPGGAMPPAPVQPPPAQVPSLNSPALEGLIPHALNIHP
jgi:hypothetical protein